MRVEELFEAQSSRTSMSSGAWYAPIFKDENKDSGLGRVRGAVKDWLADVFKATPEDLAVALKAVVASPEYEDVLHGDYVKDVTTAKERKNGTLVFRGIFRDTFNINGKWRTVNTPVNYKVLANGKVQAADDQDHFRDERKVPKPILVAGNPAKSIEKTMRRALDQVAKIIKNRVAKNAIAEKKMKADEAKASKD